MIINLSESIDIYNIFIGDMSTIIVKNIKKETFPFLPLSQAAFSRLSLSR